MEPLPFFPPSQSMASTPAFVFPQSLQGPSSLGLPPSFQHRLPDATNFLDLRLPQNALRILAESQASGRLPELFNGPAGQPVRTAKMVAAAKRKAVRFGSQPNMWKGGSASTYSQGMPAPRQVSQLPEVAQPQPPPVKARARRVARAARSRKTTTVFSHQPATTSASQEPVNQASAAQAAAPRVEATPISTHAGSSAIAEPSAASWGEGAHGEGKSTPDCGLFSWATATAAQISHHCGLDSLPLDLIEQVLPRFRAYLKESGHSAGAKTCQTSPAQFPAPVAPALPQDPWPASVSPTEYPATAPTTVALGTEEFTDNPELWSMMDCSTWAPEPEPSTMAEPTLTYEELDALEAALLQELGGAVLEPIVEEEPSAGLDFLLDLEHSQAVEGGQEEYPFAPPTREDFERSWCLPSNTHFSTELAQGAGMGGIWTGGLDFGPLT